MADMSREFVNTIVFRPPSQRESGAASTTDLAKMKKEEYRMVLRKVKDIVQNLKGEGLLKWKDPHFGPQDEDDNAASSLYRNGKVPPPTGHSSYPDPDDIAWKSPVYRPKTRPKGPAKQGELDDKQEESDEEGSDDYEDYEDEFRDVNPEFNDLPPPHAQPHKH